MSSILFVKFPGTRFSCNWRGIDKKVYCIWLNNMYKDNYHRIYPYGSLAKVLNVLSEYFIHNMEEYKTEKQAYDISLRDLPSAHTFRVSTTVNLPTDFVKAVGLANVDRDEFLNVMLYVCCGKWGREFVISHLTNQI